VPRPKPPDTIILSLCESGGFFAAMETERLKVPMGLSPFLFREAIYNPIHDYLIGAVTHLMSRENVTSFISDFSLLNSLFITVQRVC